MAFNDEMAALMMTEVDGLTQKLNQVNLDVAKTVKQLPVTIEESLSTLRDSISKSTEATNNAAAKFNEAGSALSEQMVAQLSPISSQISSVVASLAAQRTPTPSLLPYAAGIAATAIGSGISFWFGSSVGTTSWITGSAVGVLVGFAIGVVCAIAAINRIEKKYGRDLDIETASIRAYTQASRDHIKVIKTELKAELERIEATNDNHHKQFLSLNLEFMEFEKKIMRQLDRK